MIAESNVSQHEGKNLKKREARQTHLVALIWLSISRHIKKIEKGGESNVILGNRVRKNQ